MTHPSNHVHIIIHRRNNEICEFDPYPSIPHGEDGVEHHGEMSATNALINLIAERFQIDVSSIEIGQQVSQRLLTDITCRHKDIPKTFFVRQAGRIRHIFYIGERFRIGVGDAWTMVLQTEIDDSLRREVVMADIYRSNLRNLVILTVQTTEIATRTGQRQAFRARMKMIQRLLLNGVDGQRTRLAIDLADQYTVMIPSTATKARLTIGDMTMVRTELALYPIAIQSLIISTLHQNTIASYT